MEKLFRVFINRRLLIATCFVLVSAIGVYSWFQLPVDAYPDIADVTVQVVTQVPGLAAEEILRVVERFFARELPAPLRGAERQARANAHLYAGRAWSSAGDVPRALRSRLSSLASRIFSD